MHLVVDLLPSARRRSRSIQLVTGPGRRSLDVPVFAAGGALLGMVGFAKMSTKPAFYAGPHAPAAMWHDFENVQKPFWDWTKHS